MSATPSFERFDYLLRTNKHIERRLVFDVLAAAAQRMGFENHWYLGFGSMWFGDFRLAHRLLGIDRLISIELKDHAPRAKFNRPFAGVTVEPGESGEVLARLSAEIWTKPLIAWLDYDGHLNGDVVSDIDLLLERAQPNSVVIVTVNAVRTTYRARRADGRHQRHETSVGVVESFLGSKSIAPKYDPQPNGAGVFVDVPEATFPQFLTEAISTYMEHKVSASAREVAGTRVKFVPLYRLHHRDGADMVTVGGAVVADEVDAISGWKQLMRARPVLANGDGGAEYCRLDLIPVTVKEKIVLDECLPDHGDGAAFLGAARTAGLQLADDEIAKYRKFYRHFPVFVETAI